VLVVGAAGGVGSFATQIAANAGAHVIAVDAGAEERLRAYGAAETVDFTAGSVPDAADLVVSDPVEAGVMAVMLIADTASFSIEHVRGRRF